MNLQKCILLVALTTTGLLMPTISRVGAQQPRSARVNFGKKDIAGVDHGLNIQQALEAPRFVKLTFPGTDVMMESVS